MAVTLEPGVDINEVPPADLVVQLMRQRISSYLAARNDPSLYQSVRNMSQFVSDDYGNRFLVELIQNAHDAHDPSRTDGEISIVLDASDGDGCFYVANRGVGFNGSNLKAITNIALSSKPVNAGIGNKGLGFRSVLQVCNWPEIYSVQGEGGRGTFDGYCFRFATIDDLRDQLAGKPEGIAEEMARNLPCWHVPVPAEPGVAVARFAMAGFATVVRLPLKSPDALQAVRAEFDVLLGLKTPLHLFLERVGRISLDTGTGEPFVMERSVQKTWTLKPPGFNVDSPVTVAKLRLGSAEFVAANWDIDEKLFRDALQSSLEKGEVPESWKAWEGAPRISVAVPLGAPLDAGRLYCFLPLGPEGKAPFPGYINANFYTKMDRRTVDVSNRLNNLFMRMAAWLSCQLIGFLVKSEWPQAPNAVVSLLCWDEAYIETLKHAMGDNGQGILNREFLPVRGQDDAIAWASPKDAYAWVAPDDACMSPKSVCEVGDGRILVDSLTLNQRAALDHLFLRLRHSDFKPPADVVACWVERIAGKMHEDAVGPERWAVFYDEVSFALAGHASTLFGKRFLLSVSGDLISSELPASGSTGRSRRAADVYFAPVLSMDTDVDDDASKQSLPLERLPATLRKGFALLNRDVPWLKDDGGHRPGRSFLIAGKLAREYDTRDVLRTLAGVTRSSSADRTREQALEWAFRLWNSGRSLSDKETRSAGFFVPTAEGWIDAEAAMFGTGWDVPNGKKLHALLRITADGSEDLRRSLARLLLEHVAWPIRHGTPSDWVRFLSAAGVTDCLRPVGGESVASEPTGYPTSLPAAISHRVTGLAEVLRSHWRAQLTQDCARMYTSRQYRGELRPWRIPGQCEHESFPIEVRRDYAVQVALAMRAFGDEHRSFRAVRADTGAIATEPHRLSTPLNAFLTGAEWLPVTRPGGQLRFVKPSVAWYFDTDEERPPRFVDFVVHQVAAAIDATTLEWLQDRARLGLFNDERHAGRALVALAEAASSRISDIRDVRRFQELFRRMWTSARKEGSPKAGSCVPVLADGEIGVVSTTGDGPAVAYFDDELDGLKKQLLEEVGEPVFDLVRGDTIAAWNWVNASAPGRFRRISDEPAEVYIDGIKFDEGTPSQLLTGIVGPWIVDFLVCVAEHKSSAFVQSTQNTLGRIRRAAIALAVVMGRQIQIAHGDERVALPPSLRGALTLHRAVGPVLIIQAADGPFTLDYLAGAAGQLAAALGSRELTHGLDAALLRLAASMRDQSGETPDDSIVAAALGVDPEAIRKTRRLASGDLIGMLDLAIPLAACIGTPETTSRLQELSAQDDPRDEELRAALEALALSLGMPLADLEERMMHLVDLSDLKREFSLPIAQLNAAIAAIGGRYKPVSNEQMHRDAWTRHLRLRQPVTVESLRVRATGTFDRGEALSAYVVARDGGLAISPDPAWFTAYDELPEGLMNAHIDRWIDDLLPSETAEIPLNLTLNESRTSNGALLRSFWVKFAPILSAWVRAPGIATTGEVRQAWVNPETAHDACIGRARDSGWLDFRSLDEGQIAYWLSLDGVWPVGHPANADLASWGLSTDSIASSEELAKAARAEHQRRRSQVQFSGVTMSAHSDGYADIAAAVAAAAARAPALDHVSSNDAKLEPMDLTKASGGSGGGSSRGAPKLPESGMSDEQKLAVGLIGELWAREWLRRRHNLDAVDESIWVSGYRDAVLNTSGGSDSLGYDFIVTTKSRTYYYEVKASTGNPLRFEMGPTEIFAAQRYRTDREHRYRILYLSNVGDPVQMTPTLLANPFSAPAAGRFRAVGKGSVVYEFDPTHMDTDA